MHIHVTLSQGQVLSSDEEESLLGGPATETIITDGITEISGPETTRPDNSNAMQAFEEGRINGYGTQYR